VRKKQPVSGGPHFGAAQFTQLRGTPNSCWAPLYELGKVNEASNSLGFPFLCFPRSMDQQLSAITEPRFRPPRLTSGPRASLPARHSFLPSASLWFLGRCRKQLAGCPGTVCGACGEERVGVTRLCGALGWGGVFRGRGANFL
jgi:hypothetical protein